MAGSLTHVGSGGFTPKIVRRDLSLSGFPNFLANIKNKRFRPVGATYAASSVAADGNGNKIIKAGQLCTKITSAAGTSTSADIGKFGPYDPAASDGRQTIDPSDSGYCPESINLADGDTVFGLLTGGNVWRQRVTPSTITTPIQTALMGRFSFFG